MRKMMDEEESSRIGWQDLKVSQAEEEYAADLLAAAVYHGLERDSAAPGFDCV